MSNENFENTSENKLKRIRELNQEIQNNQRRINELSKEN